MGLHIATHHGLAFIEFPYWGLQKHVYWTNNTNEKSNKNK